MKRRFLALAGALVVIGVLAFALWRHGQRSPPPPTLLYTLAPGAVTVIDARWTSADRIVLRRGRHGWRMVEPVRAPADATRVYAFVDALSEPVTRRYAAAKVPLAGAGLAPPRLRLRINGQTATFGRRNPATGLRYVRRGQSIFTVSDTLLPRLAAGPWQFLSTRLIPPGRAVQAVQLDEGPPSHEPALVSAWQQARSESVGPADSSPAPPGARIRVLLAQDEQPLVFEVLSRRPRLRIERNASKLVYTFPAAAASRLLPASGHA